MGEHIARDIDVPPGTLHLDREQPLVLLWDAVEGGWSVFRDPCDEIRAETVREVGPSLERIQSLAREHGLHAAGFLTYEAGAAFDPAYQVRARTGNGPPLLWFGVFRRVERMAPQCMTAAPGSIEAEASRLDWVPSISGQRYQEALRSIREHLRVGDSYQVNFTFRLRTDFPVTPWDFFQGVCRDHPAAHAAYVRLDDWAMCSFSPERFFLLDGEEIVSEPMKGTRPRGRTLGEDLVLSEELRGSPKERAENVMITDMVRNDLGRIAVPGSVVVDDLCRVEKHATVWQMVSTVRARTRCSLPQIFAALFPPASITGAPKAASMGIIAELESDPRHVYTGCIGFVGPGTPGGPSEAKPGLRAAFNVAIRTVQVDTRRNQAEYGVGGGIVWDSDARGEYAECRTKAEILHRRMPPFRLLETMLWTPHRGYVLLGRHLARLRDSAAYFDYSLDLSQVRGDLAELAASLLETGSAPRVVRLLLDRHGAACLEDLPPPVPVIVPPRVALAKTPVDSRDVFLFHKTTHRIVYSRALASRPGHDDVLLVNERGELTESSRANLALSLGGILYTPPIHCGLLGGTLRAEMLERGELQERVLRLEDLHKANRVMLLNSVRGMQVVVTDNEKICHEHVSNQDLSLGQSPPQYAGDEETF